MLGDGTCADIGRASIITTAQKIPQSFSLTWLALKSVYIRKEFPRDWFGTPTWRMCRHVNYIHIFVIISSLKVTSIFSRDV